MSLFIIPTLDARAQAQPCQRRTVTANNGCGSPAVRSPFDLIFGGDHFGRHPFAAVDDEETRYAAYEARLRHQQQLEERRLQERYATLRRQAEIERERERRRIRAHQEQQQRRRQAALAAAAAAHAAWQEEQERQVRAALEKQQQHQQRRQQEALAAAERQRAWQQRQAQEAAARRHRQHSYDEQVAAAVAQEQWEEVAKQGLAVAFEFAKNLFGLEENDEDSMEVDQQGKSDVAGPSSSTPAANAPVSKENEKNDEVVDKATTSFEDPPEVVPTKTNEAVAEPQQKLVFTHPLPSDASQRAAIKADDIQVQYDEQSRSIVVRGLWQDNVGEDAASSDGHTVTSSDDEEQSRGRKRSRSPKRSRVSDVDEKTGEEIVQTGDNTIDADGFVNVTANDAKGKQAQGSARIPVPEGASVSGLRAELTDDGFQVWL